MGHGSFLLQRSQTRPSSTTSLLNVRDSSSDMGRKDCGDTVVACGPSLFLSLNFWPATLACVLCSSVLLIFLFFLGLLAHPLGVHSRRCSCLARRSVFLLALLCVACLVPDFSFLSLSYTSSSL
ncbi:hypothetical protein HETIRDRAFT_168568 [Heterobasidion irregulare TC 32-1]|uniref:Uncharacterized protein n=1 Tax=Heterobasidion irregulare (strain TC 32-1) TaxID=747525 RepID=W4KJB5_HETIT|nr:uncharacterized protein HETIRDRAFT_168568 [Heterobasidion irregulare TC 32-1]ETW85161.1 hypothetical protein HETIRDRAFT_168568 [Heterobasidion irregulare TC 32-1]